MHDTTQLGSKLQLTGLLTGWRQVDKQFLKLCPCARFSVDGVTVRAGLLGTHGGVEEKGKTDGGWKGVMQLWTLPAHLPRWKRTVYGVHPRLAH